MAVRAVLRLGNIPIVSCEHPQGSTRILEEICQRPGGFRYAMMETAHVAKFRDEKAAFPHAANNRVKALRQLFAWATSPE